MRPFVVDDREPGEIQDLLVALGAEVRRLPHGDVHAGDWLVERKTAGDFVSSLLDGRLLRQVPLLRSSGLCPIVVVEGPIERDADFSDALLAACHGALAALAATHAVPVVPTTDARGTRDFVKSLLKRRVDDCYEMREPLVKLRRADPYVAMLAQVPGIGAKRAEAIASAYPSFAAFERLRFYEMVDAFGPKTAATLWRLLRGRDVPAVYRRMGTGKRARRLVDANPALEREDAPVRTLADALALAPAVGAPEDASAPN